MFLCLQLLGCTWGVHDLPVPHPPDKTDSFLGQAQVQICIIAIVPLEIEGEGKEDEKKIGMENWDMWLWEETVETDHEADHK